VGSVSFQLLLGQAVIGVSLAANLFLIASGLTIIFGLLRLINFAHASLYALGAYFCFSFASAMHSFWAGAALSVLLTAAVGAVMETGLLRRIYDRDHILQLLLTYAVILVVTDATKLGWGAFPLTVSPPPALSGSVELLGSAIPVYCFFLIGAGLAVGVGLALLLYRTKWGTIIRTAAYDREMTGALGVDVSRLYTVVFALGAGLGGLGGAVAAPMTTIVPDMGMLIIIDSFAVIVVGGVGSLAGAAVGSLIIGVWGAIGLLIVPQFAMVFTFVLMAAILLVRPWGLLGDRF
jgi:branched-subunit amino acid ABC-type transport system permease component